MALAAAAEGCAVYELPEKKRESRSEVALRGERFLAALGADPAAEAETRRVLLVSHGGFILTLLGAVCGLHVDMVTNCSITRLRVVYGDAGERHVHLAERQPPL